MTVASLSDFVFFWFYSGVLPLSKAATSITQLKGLSADGALPAPHYVPLPRRGESATHSPVPKTRCVPF